MKNAQLSRIPIPVLLVVLLFAGASDTHADVSVTNGDFELPGTFVSSTFAQGITGWGEDNHQSDNFADFLIIGDTTQQGAYLDGQTAGLSNHVVGDGYLYQEIGTPDGLPTLRIEGVNFWRNDSSNQHGQLQVEAFWLPSSSGFAFQEVGNDIAGTGNLIASHLIADPSTQNATVPFSIDIDVSTLATDARLFIRFDAGTPGQFAYVDNVSVAMVPEPGCGYVCLLIGIIASIRLRGHRGA